MKLMFDPFIGKTAISLMEDIRDYGLTANVDGRVRTSRGVLRYLLLKKLVQQVSVGRVSDIVGPVHIQLTPKGRDYLEAVYHRRGIRMPQRIAISSK